MTKEAKITENIKLPQGRVLSDEEINNLKTYTLGLIQINKTKASLILAKLLNQEDINYESSLTLFGYIGGDIELLKKTYYEYLEGSELKDQGTISELEISHGTDKKQAHKIEREILSKIYAPKHYGMIVGSLGSDTLVIADPKSKTTSFETSVIKNDNDYSRQKKVIDAYPSKVIVYDSPLAEEPRKFEITWESKIKKSILITGPDLLEDIKNDLVRDGYVVANRLINDILPALMNTYIRKGLAEIKTDIETNGFFHNPSTNEMISVKYDLTDPPKEELKEALKILNELAKWYTGNEKKLATVFKWGLISPFIYSKKQQGSWTPWLYLYGKARSGKTTLGQMVLYMWGEPSADNDLTGSGFDTVARVGGKISQNTFPIVVNEPAGAFQRVSVVEMLKGAIERTISRGRYEGRRYTNIPSFNPVIFTANQFMPDDDALNRRMWILNFTHNEKKSKEEIELFEEEWQTKNHNNCKFNAFKSICQAVSQEYVYDSELWDLDWKELADTLITRAYLDAGYKPENIPSWIYKWSTSESMEDMDEEHREDIRIFFLNQINRAYGTVKLINPDNGRMVDNEELYEEEIKTTRDFKGKVWTVLNERLIPWMVPVSQKDKNYVCLTVGFKKEIHHELKICQPLKGLSELMGWDYENVRMPEQHKVIKIKLDKFLDFLYPSEKKEKE